MASARAPPPAAHGSRAVTTSTPCTWVRPNRRAGSAPTDAAARALFSSTFCRSSRLDRLQFRLAYGPPDTPPRRVKNPCGTCIGSTVSASAINTRLRKELPAGCAQCAVTGQQVLYSLLPTDTTSREDNDDRDRLGHHQFSGVPHRA